MLDDLRRGGIPEDLTLPTAVDQAFVLFHNRSGSSIRCLEDQIAGHALGGAPCLSGSEISESSRALYDKRVRVFGRDVV
jgi:hypothetical protein